MQTAANFIQDTVLGGPMETAAEPSYKFVRISHGLPFSLSSYLDLFLPLSNPLRRTSNLARSLYPCLLFRFRQASS
jgi:hypothetical protein